MSWVLRQGAYSPPLYWSGAGWTSHPTFAVRFGFRCWAVTMFKGMKRNRPSLRIVKRIASKKHRCRPGCPCLVDEKKARKR